MSAVQESPVQVYLLTLGCPKNDADSRSIRRDLTRAGVCVVDDPRNATHIVVNTCGFIQDAKEESIETILGVCREYPEKKVLAMGCLVERYRDDLARGIPEVSGWLGLASANTSQELLRAVAATNTCASVTTDRGVVATRSYAYLKISDGCDEGCTFCAIPRIKGRYASASLEEILREADACLAEGARELVLVGQDTTRWKSGHVGLQGLVDILASDDRVRRVRVMYLQPSRLDDAFLEFMARNPKVCRYLDIPFQHSHPAVLRSMGRRGDGGVYSELLRRAHEYVPGVATRSTFIVGFPGETASDFDHLVRFVEEAGFDYGGAFIYSPEEGTKAETLLPRVGRRVAMRRLELLNDVLLQAGVRKRESVLGTEVEVMVDSADTEEAMDGCGAVGRTEGQAPEVDGVTYIAGRDAADLSPGDSVRVKIVEVLGCDLVGDVCAP